jgi:membrane fusion protein, multidrug efflux system
MSMAVFEKKLRWRRSIRPIVGLVILVAVAVGIRELSGSTPPASSGARTSEAAIPVAAAVAKQQDVPDFIHAIGTVQSMDSVAVQPRVSGSIEKVEFTPGQDVKKGQELFLIDPRPYQVALDQAHAQLARDEAVLKEAQVNLTRYQTLERQNSIARQQAEDQVYVVQQDKGTVLLDQANVEMAKLNLGYCHVTAPISGRAGALLVDLGNLVGPQGGTAAASGTSTTSATGAQPTSGSTLVSITQLQPIYVSFNVPQTMLDEILRNQATGALEADAYSQVGKLLEKGKLTLVNNQVNTATGTVMLQGTFANAGKTLWPGEYVSVQLVLGIRRNVVTVPASAVMVGPNGDYVYVIDSNNKVKRVGVQQAARQGGISVLSKGISAGQTVVAKGQYRLDNGTVVAVQQTTVPRPAARSAAGEEPAAADPPQ